MKLQDPNDFSGLVCTARAQVTIEIERGTWGHDCTVAQVYDQAGREAINELNRLVSEARRANKGALRNMRIIGDPKVVAVTTGRE